MLAKLLKSIYSVLQLVITDINISLSRNHTAMTSQLLYHPCGDTLLAQIRDKRTSTTMATGIGYIS